MRQVRSSTSKCIKLLEGGGKGGAKKAPPKQVIVSEDDSDVIVEVAGVAYLAELGSGLVFTMPDDAEPVEVGTWDAAKRAIVFSSTSEAPISGYLGLFHYFF